MPHLGELLSSKNEQRKHPVCTSSPLFFSLCFCSPRIPADLPLFQNLFSFSFSPYPPVPSVFFSKSLLVVLPPASSLAPLPTRCIPSNLAAPISLIPQVVRRRKIIKYLPSQGGLQYPVR